ncbi:TPA: hypothetical protein N0F65_002114 [Lagenidium giganteum]|uniref:AAA+ ATPase domain-containing protein n=1 Tax=Lagenidium giganteum TaxID=4803 RepID=A0AAV2ZGE8_9STRA|nr:TPA: hypothetical protein N0F65_002114 [Lagenidium giganteum]
MDAFESQYERTKRHSELDDGALHRVLWQQAEYTEVQPSNREAVTALQRHHFENFLRRQRDVDSDDRIVERRAKRRTEWRKRWPNAECLTLDDIKTGCPSLFAKDASAPSESPSPPKIEHANALAAGNAKPAAAAAPAPWDVADYELPTTRQPPPPVNVGNTADTVSAPQAPSLSFMLRKKTSREGSDEDDFSSRSRPPVPALSRNPFQTANDKLQRDRLLGKVDDEDRRDGGSGLRRNSGGRKPQYHPINSELLFGGNRNRDDDDMIPSSSSVNKKFVSPAAKSEEEKRSKNGSTSKPAPNQDDENIDPRLKSCDPELISKIELEIVDSGDPVHFDDIAGLQFAKRCVNELVIWPMARPDIFTGLRSLPKGLLLFGPPGTGKTLIGKAIASESGATFFSISASSLTSKWIGEGEKLVRTLFAVAAVKQPSVIFIDEIDSLLTQRSSEENEASRRMKTEFLVQLDGAGTKASDVILVVGATNRPQELDEAARRRFVKRLYIPLPSFEARLDLINRLLRDNKHNLSEENKRDIAEKSQGYSGADVRALCTEAAMEPIRSCVDIRTMDADSVRPISQEDFVTALRGVRPSVGAKDLDFYRDWNAEFGSFPIENHEVS